jgi:predicted NAD/FAD-dependent oxidoreductase
MAGIAAARVLDEAGIESFLFEKSKGVGGRGATRRLGPYTFDFGATSVTPRGMGLAKAMLEDEPTDDLVKIEKPIYRHSSGRISPGDKQKNLSERYTYKDGISRLTKLLSRGLVVDFSRKIERVELPGDGGYCLEDATFDVLILTPPAPQTHALLGAMGIDRGLGPLVYRQTLAVMMGFDRPFDAPWHALIDPDQDEPLTWLSAEHLKCPGTRAPAGCSAFVAQMSRSYSRTRFDAPDEVVLRETLVDLQRLVGSEFREPEVWSVHRWRYAQPEAVMSFDAANPPGSTVLIAGDALEGPRMESAYESGLRAGRRVLELAK